MKAFVRKFSKRNVLNGGDRGERQSTKNPPVVISPLPHTVHLQHHPQYPPRAIVKKVRWTDVDPDYHPVDFTHPVVFKFDRTITEKGWADPAEWTPEFELEVSQRRSYSLELHGKVIMVNGRPRNPLGRTGMIGRGLVSLFLSQFAKLTQQLGKWGPNHAADPLVTRFSPETGKLQMVAIRRKDTGDWAIPGGMVDAGETVSVTLKREFLEEARNFSNDAEQQFVQEKIEELFASGGRMTYFGYVDDPRNTDNSWMETVCVHFHIRDESLAAHMPLNGGDDAAAAKWLDVDDSFPDFRNLYVNHRDMVIRALMFDAELFGSALARVKL
jgi:ADP-ribose pyrophosphatase